MADPEKGVYVNMIFGGGIPRKLWKDIGEVEPVGEGVWEGCTNKLSLMEGKFALIP